MDRHAELLGGGHGGWTGVLIEVADHYQRGKIAAGVPPIEIGKGHAERSHLAFGRQLAGQSGGIKFVVLARRIERSHAIGPIEGKQLQLELVLKFFKQVVFRPLEQRFDVIHP
jgi:hypothetical protein